MLSTIHPCVSDIMKTLKSIKDNIHVNLMTHIVSFIMTEFSHLHINANRNVNLKLGMSLANHSYEHTASGVS